MARGQGGWKNLICRRIKTVSLAGRLHGEQDYSGDAFLGCALSWVLTVAQATNGYSPTGFGTANKGLAGAGVALPQDAMAACDESGRSGSMSANRFDLGVAMFAPDRGFTADNNAGPPPMAPGDPSSVPPGTYDSRNDYFLIPHFGWNKQIDEVSSIGVLVGANGGMNTEYGSAVWRNFNDPGAPRTRKLAHRGGFLPVVSGRSVCAQAERTTCRRHHADRRRAAFQGRGSRAVSGPVGGPGQGDQQRLRLFMGLRCQGRLDGAADRTPDTGCLGAVPPVHDQVRRLRWACSRSRAISTCRRP